MSKLPVHIYLIFSGRCEEALRFYKETIGAEIKTIMKFNEAPQPPPSGTLQPGFEDKVMHSEFVVNGTTIMASDGQNDKNKFCAFSLMLSCQNEVEAKGAFRALSDGGKVTMPMGPTFWSPCFGMLVDKFGMGWMVMVPGEPPRHK